MKNIIVLVAILLSAYTITKSQVIVNTNSTPSGDFLTTNNPLFTGRIASSTDGDETNPAYSFSSGSGTGIFKNGNSLNFAANAVYLLSLDSDGLTLIQNLDEFIGGFRSKGNSPAVSNTSANSCGTTAAILIGNDNNGIITVGATSGTSCTITFINSAVGRRECIANNESAAALARGIYIDNTHSKIDGTFGAGALISYICFPR